MNNSKLLIYDFEVFLKDWMIVVINYDTKEKTIIINNKEELQNFYNLNKESIWIGYNNVYYDQYIFKGILAGKNPYNISNDIINNGVHGKKLLKPEENIQMYNSDLSNKFRGLKELEGFMGLKIKESSVDFNIKRKLTKEELREVLEYCIHDVNSTMEVYENLKEELESHRLMIETFNLPMEMFDRTKANLSAHILDAKKPEKDRNDEFNLSFPNTIILDKYNFIFDWYKDYNNRNYKKSLNCEISGVPHLMGWGGIHGAIPSYMEEGEFIMSDIASMYPAIMIEYDYLSRNVKNSEKYREIRDERIILKKKKDKRQAPLKIVLNSTYGASKHEFNELFDPLMANNVCVGGQLLLLDLIEKVEPYCKLVQSNTDGILVKIENKENRIKYLEECDKWSKRVRLDLEHDDYTKVIQGNVNNYIIVDKKGKYKSKGAYVKGLSKIDYDLPIVNEALINYFIHNIPIEKTILSCDEFIKFQKIVKITSNYNCAYHNDKQIKEKVSRVYASTDENDGMIYKIKGEDKFEKIANTPEKCFIYNDEVLNLKCPEKLDKFYYIDVALDRVKKFKENESNKIKSGIKGVKLNTLQWVENNTKFYTNFINIYEDMLSLKFGKSEILNLIKLEYFKEFANTQKLLNFLNYMNKLKNKTYKKSKIDPDLEKYIVKYSSLSNNGETYTNLDKKSILKDIWDNLEDLKISSKETVRFQYELLKYIDDIPDDISVGKIMLVSKKNHSLQIKSIRNNNIQWFKVDKKLELYDKKETIIINKMYKKTGWKQRVDWWIEDYEKL